jgi:hypothetical protein
VTNEDVVHRLDTVIAVLKLAHRTEIEETRVGIRGDKVSAAILDLSARWTPAGKLTASVRRKTKQSERTVKRRVAELLRDGILEKRGGGPAIEYRATGLV